MDCYGEVVRVLGIISAMREPFDHHGWGVAELATKMCQEMGMPPADCALIEAGANLHDIGKLLVRAEVLNAPRRLAESERSEIRTHAMLGWSIVERAGYDQVILDTVRHHHENMDGSGYPDGLMGHEIPLPARIVRICDVYEALTHKRPYREAYSHNFTMAFIQKDKNTLYDGELVDLFFARVATNG